MHFCGLKIWEAPIEEPKKEEPKKEEPKKEEPKPKEPTPEEEPSPVEQDPEIEEPPDIYKFGFCINKPFYIMSRMKNKRVIEVVDGGAQEYQ